MVLLLPFLLSGTVLMAQQGFGTNNPASTAVVDMEASHKGLLIPRVKLKATNDSAPISGTPAPFLLVFNTENAGTAPTNVAPGFYYWNNGGWIRLLNAGELSAGSEWNVDGNVGAGAVLGTKDAKDMVIKTANNDRLHITSGGSVGVNTASPSSSALLELSSTTQGFLPPRMAASNVSSPSAGMVIYNTTSNCLAYYNGTEFKCFSYLSDANVAAAKAAQAEKETYGRDFTNYYNGVFVATPTYYNGSVYDPGFVILHSTGQVFSDNKDCQDQRISAGGCKGQTTVVGKSGHVYPLTEINGQCWIAENLQEIPENFKYVSNSSWKNNDVNDMGYWGYYNSADDDGSSGFASTEAYNKAGHNGYLYQWSAAMNGTTGLRAQGLCPANFHIPSDCEFQYFEHGLGMSISGQNNWTDDAKRDGCVDEDMYTPRVFRKLLQPLWCAGCSNVTGFNVVAAGYRRGTSGKFVELGNWEHWWVSQKTSDGEAYYRKVDIGSTGIARYSNTPDYGMSVRCLRD